jgi:hypothetical protein
VAEGFVLAGEIYLALGALVALAFAAFGIVRIDPAARGSSIVFRLMVIPGATLLWPLVALKWAFAKDPETEEHS